MKTKTHHTPPPWYLKENSHVPNVGIYKDITEKGDSWPTSECIAFLDEGMLRAKANAEFIVRAVNSYGQTLRALKKVQRWMNDRKLQSNLETTTAEESTELYGEIWDAIDKAEGKEATQCK